MSDNRIGFGGTVRVEAASGKLLHCKALVATNVGWRDAMPSSMSNVTALSFDAA